MNYQRELADVLLGYLGPLRACEDAGLQITEFALDVPLEVTGGMRRGDFVILGSAPHSRWQAGFLPRVHRTSMTVTLADPEA